MFGCGVTVLQNVVSSSNILNFAVLRHWIPRSINRHTIAMAEKANCDKKKSRIYVFNNYNNNGGESLTNKEQVRFTKQLESTQHCEFTKHAGTHELAHEGMHEFKASSINCQRVLLGNSGY